MESVLKLGVDTSGVRKGAQDLDGLATSGNRAERAAGGVATAAERLKSALTGIGIAAIARELVQTADAATLLNAKLSLVVSGTAALARAQGDLFNIAQRTRVAFGQTVDLFTSMSRATQALGLSQQRVLGVTETINKSLIISGTSAQSAAAALVQLGQGFASGTLRGEELNSVLEQAPRLAQAIAEGLGVTVGQLRKLGEEGKLTADAVFGALERSGASINAEFSKIPLTVGGAVQQARNAFQLLVSEIDKAAEGTSSLAGLISEVASATVEFTRELKKAGEGSEDIGLLATAVQAAIEAIRVLGANVAFVFKGVGREIGAVAAQAVALAKLDIKGFNAISAAVREDAARARAELDAFERRVLEVDKRTKAALAQQQRVEDRGFVPPSAPTGVVSGKSGAAKQSEADKYAESLRLQIQRINELSAVEKLLEDIQAGRLGKVNEKDRARLQALAEQVDASKRLKSQLEAEANQIKDLRRYEKDLADQQDKRNAADEQRRLAIEEIGTAQDTIARKTIEALEFETQALQLTNREREVAIALRRLEEQGITRGTVVYQLYADAIRKAVIDRSVVQESIDQQKKIEQEWERTTAQIGQSLSDALIDGGKSAWEYIKGLFRATVLRPVIQGVVAPVTGALASLTSTPAAASGAGGIGAIASIASSLSSAGSFFATGFMNTVGGSGVAGGLGAAGSLISGGATASGLATAAGAVAPYVVAAVVASAAIKSLFGRKLADSGIQGTLGGSGGFSGQAFEFFKGGLLRSDKTVTSAIDPQLAGALQQGVSDIRASVSEYAKAIGLSASAVDSFTQDIKLSFKDLTPEQIQAKIEETLKAFSDGLAGQFAEAVAPFAKAGEETTATLQRLGQSVQSANAVLAQLGLSLFEISTAGGDAASQLLDLFGGADKFAQTSARYFERYYKEAERVDIATQQITQALSDVGLSLPATREEFRALVEAQDRTTDAGRQAFAVLLSVSDAFDFVTSSAEEAAKAAEEAAEKQREAAERLAQQLAQAIDANIDAFLSPAERMSRELGKIQQSLAGAGVGVSIETLTGASKEQIFEFARAFVEAGANSDEAKIAIVEAAGALARFKDEAATAAAELESSAIQKQLDGIAREFGDLSVIAEPVKTLADSFRDGTTELRGLEQGLANLLGTVGKTVQETLADMLAQQKALQGFRAQLAGSIEEALLGSLDPSARIARLRSQESGLFGQLQTASDPVAVAQQLQQVVIRRIKEEAGLRQQAEDARIEALRQQVDLAREARDAQIDTLRQQISGFERLRKLSEELGQFTSELRIGDLSPLSPERQLAEARSLFASTVQAALAGDENAVGNVRGNAQALLNEAKTFFGSATPEFSRIFNQVIGKLDQLGLAGQSVDPQIAALEASLSELQALNAAQADIKAAVIDTSQDTYDALTAIDQALALRDASNQSAIAEQTELAKQQIQTQKDALEVMRAQITQAAEIEKSLRAELEAVNAKLQAQLDNTTLAGAAP